jgi:hypothetical protein
VSLEGAHELGEVRRRIGEFASRRTDLDWICAENAVYAVVEGRRPNAADLDGLTGPPDLRDHLRPALGVAERGRAHGTRHRRRRRRRVGPPDRDPVTGEPTGWVTDFYTSAMTEAGPRATAARHPDVLAATALPQAVRQHAHGHHALGITTVVERQVPLVELPLFERALAERVLTRG